MKTKSFVLRKLQIQSPHIRRVFFYFEKNLCNEKNSLISNMISDSMSLYYIKSKWQRCAQRVFQVCQKKLGDTRKKKGCIYILRYSSSSLSDSRHYFSNSHMQVAVVLMSIISDAFVHCYTGPGYLFRFSVYYYLLNRNKGGFSPFKYKTLATKRV